MGLLGDLIKQKYDQEQANRMAQVDMYKSALQSSDITPEATDYALDQIIALTGMPNKQKGVMKPFFQAILGMGKGKDSGAGMDAGMGAGTDAGTDAVPNGGGGSGNGQPQPVTGMSGMGTSGDNSPRATGMESPIISPSAILYGPEEPDPATTNIYPRVESTPAPAQPPAAATTQPSSPTSSPTSSPVVTSRTRPAFRYTPQQKLGFKMDELRSTGNLNMEMQAKERERKLAELQKNKDQYSPQQYAYALAAIQGIQFPALPTLQTRKVLLRDGSTATVQENPKDPTQWVVAGTNTPFDTSTMVMANPTDREITEYRAQMSYASDNKTTVDQLTPEQKILAVQNNRQPTGELGQLEMAFRDLADPNAPPERKQAAKMIIDKAKNTDSALVSRIAMQMSNGDVESIADGIEQGIIPPDMKGYYRMKGPLVAALAKRGYNLVEAEKDWGAVTQNIRTLNGVQIRRQVNAIDTMIELLPQAQQAFEAWKQKGFQYNIRVFNSATLKMAVEAGSPEASELQRIITDLTADIGSIYKMGNAATDESLEIAKMNLGANWSEAQFKAAVTNLTKFGKIRKTSIATSAPMGVSSSSPYLSDMQRNRLNGEEPFPTAGQDPNQQGGSGQGQGQGGKFSSGGYDYEEIQVPAEVAQKIAEGQVKPVGPEGAQQVLVKRYRGKFYRMSATGKGNGGKR